MESSSLDKRRRGISSETIASTLLFVSLWLFWGVRYGDYLFAAQENSLFLYRSDFLTRWLEVPDGLLCYITSFLIQFFYYPLLGGAILAGLGVGVQRALAKMTGLRGVGYVATFLPVCFMTVSATWPSYFIFIPFNVPLIFSESIALLAVWGALALYKSISNPKLRFVYALALVRIGYVGFGCWATIACLFFALNELTNAWPEDKKAKRRRIAYCVGLVAASFIIPLALQRFLLFPRLQIYNVFTCGLIEDVRYDKDSLTATFAYGLVYLTPLYCFVLYGLTRWLALRAYGSDSVRAQKRAEKLMRKAQKKQQGKSGSGSEKIDTEKARVEAERLANKRRVQLLFELLFLLALATVFASYHSRSFFDCLATCRALSAADWDKILEIDSKNPYPINQLVGLRNLALFKTGRLAEDAFKRPIGGESTLTVTVADNAKALAGNPYYKAKMKIFDLQRTTEQSAYRAMCELAFCHWGLTNVAARVATDNLVATEDRSISFSKTLAIAAIVNGEKKLARRYLRLLEETTFYKKWARVRLAYLDSSAFNEGVRDYNTDDAYMLAKEERKSHEESGLSFEEAAKKRDVSLDELKRVAALVSEAREMRPPRDIESKKAYPNTNFLMDVVRFDEYDSSSLQRKELILLSALFQKKRDVFLSHIEDYLALKGCAHGGAPRAIEQGYATWRFSSFQDKWQDCEYKFTEETIAHMDAVTVYLNTYGASGVAVQATLRENCAGTYWGYALDESTFKQY